jgi:hypothetical protein
MEASCFGFDIGHFCAIPQQVGKKDELIVIYWTNEDTWKATRWEDMIYTVEFITGGKYFNTCVLCLPSTRAKWRLGFNELFTILFFWEDDSWQILLILEAFFITPLQKKISILKDVIVASLTLIHFVNVIIFIFFSCIQYIFHYLQNKYSFSICSVRSRQIYSLILMKNDFSHWTCLILWLAWSGNMHKFSERLKYPPSQSSDSYPLQ